MWRSTRLDYSLSTQYDSNVNDRQSLGLTQTAAANRAGVSLATWRRWEQSPESVSAKTRIACEGVLDKPIVFEQTVRQEKKRYEDVWGDSNCLTPRQAYAISSVLCNWKHLYIDEWLRDANAPLHDISPFDDLDLRVMMLVNENKAWAAKASERCAAVAEEIDNGVLPFDRPGCYFDELLMAFAIRDAESLMNDMPELFDDIAPQLEVTDDDDDRPTDMAWDAVSDKFDDQCRWDEWEVPLFSNHPLLRTLLSQKHPFTWFDTTPATGPGYLNRLLGIECLVDDPERSS